MSSCAAARACVRHLYVRHLPASLVASSCAHTYDGVPEGLLLSNCGSSKKEESNAWLWCHGGDGSMGALMGHKGDMSACRNHEVQWASQKATCCIWALGSTRLVDGDQEAPCLPMGCLRERLGLPLTGGPISSEAPLVIWAHPAEPIPSDGCGLSLTLGSVFHELRKT